MTSIGPIGRRPAESEDKWQKHMMVVLWVGIVVFIALSAVLVYAEYHGWFLSSSNQPVSPAAWPTGLSN